MKSYLLIAAALVLAAGAGMCGWIMFATPAHMVPAGITGFILLLLAVMLAMETVDTLIHDKRQAERRFTGKEIQLTQTRGDLTLQIQRNHRLRMQLRKYHEVN